MSTLSTNAILQGMADALPSHRKGYDGSDLSSSYEVIALVVHSYLTALGFKLYGFNEGTHLRTPLSLPSPHLSFSLSSVPPSGED